MKKTCILLLVLLIPALSFSQEESILYPDLSEEIFAMRGPDQKLRRKWIKLRQKGKSKKAKKVGMELYLTDQRNTARLREIVAEIGWPTIQKVGPRASDTAWLIAQHADRRPLFQIACLPLLKAAVDSGQAKPSNYAYLYDRVQLAKGDKQLYATQSSYNDYTNQGFFQALEDESKVQERREAMGLTRTVVEYATQLGFSYQIPTEAEAIARSDSFARAYTAFIEAAESAMQQADYLTAADAYIQAMQSDGSVTAKDLVAGARALSLSEHKKASRGWYLLNKAAIRGWEDLDSYTTDSDFDYLRTINPEGWQDLMANVAELKEMK